MQPAPGCLPGANAWIEAVFHDCIYTTWDALSFALGLAALALWLVAQLPQFVANYRNKSADALSLLFILHWLVGDSCNLAGCLLSGEQLPTTTYLAAYFMSADILMLAQYCWYELPKSRRCVPVHLRTFQPSRPRPGRSAHPELSRLGPYVSHTTGTDAALDWAGGAQDAARNGSTNASGARPPPLRPGASSSGACTAAPQQGAHQHAHPWDGEPGVGACLEAVESETMLVLEEQLQRLGCLPQIHASPSVTLPPAPWPHRRQGQAGPAQAQLLPASEAQRREGGAECSYNGQCPAQGELPGAGLPVGGEGQHSRSRSSSRDREGCRVRRQGEALGFGAAPRGYAIAEECIEDKRREQLQHTSGGKVLRCSGKLHRRLLVPLTTTSAAAATALTLLAVAALTYHHSQPRRTAVVAAPWLGSISELPPAAAAADVSAQPRSDTTPYTAWWRFEPPGCHSDGSWDAAQPWWCDATQLQKAAGVGLGYAAMAIHIVSRLPQIWHTWSRRSSEGLSAAMFALAVSANLCTGLSIALRVSTRQELLARLPWLGNALGTVSLDCVIIFLALTLRRRPPGNARVGDDALCTASGDLGCRAVQEGDMDEEEAGLRHPFLPAQT